MLSNTLTGAYALVAAALTLPSLTLALPQDVTTPPAEVDVATIFQDGCTALINAGLKSQVYFPGDQKYASREASYWAADARLGPKCIVQPRNPAEVAKALQTVGWSTSNFAVRSGGHSQWAGGSNIKDGVTIDLGLLNSATYDKKTNLASLGPGSSWGEVFNTLEKNYGVAVAGGRDSGVGIGGFLTGAGNSYYTGLKGFGVDNICNFEVVLTDGRIVNANASTNSDLWKVLKGGSGNFGIVTRFDMEAFPASPLWGGMRFSNKTYADNLINSFVKFNDNSEKNPQDAHILLFTHNPALFPEVVAGQVLVSTNNVPKAPSFKEILAVPSLFEDIKTRSMAEVATSFKQAPGKLNVWFSLSFKNDIRIIKEAVRLHDVMIKDILAAGVPASAFNTQSLFQPIPAYFARIGVQKGGNILGMENEKSNSVLWLGIVDATTPAYEKIVRQKLTTYTQAIEAYSKKLSGEVAWKYVNYVDGTQNPLRSYGNKNFNLMLAAAFKYDPLGIIQRKSLAGFKLWRS